MVLKKEIRKLDTFGPIYIPNMYLTETCIYDRFNPEEYNDFKFWREPIMEISLDDLKISDVGNKKEAPVSSQFDSFLYWRDPIPSLDEL